MSVQKEKTAMMMLIELWEKLRDDKSRANGISDEVYDGFIADAKLSLITERRNIVIAALSSLPYDSVGAMLNKAEEYYESKYGNK